MLKLYQSVQKTSKVNLVFCKAHGFAGTQAYYLTRPIMTVDQAILTSNNLGVQHTGSVFDCQGLGPPPPPTELKPRFQCGGRISNIKHFHGFWTHRGEFPFPNIVDAFELATCSGCPRLFNDKMAWSPNMTGCVFIQKPKCCKGHKNSFWVWNLVLAKQQLWTVRRALGTLKSKSQSVIFTDSMILSTFSQTNTLL